MAGGMGLQVRIAVSAVQAAIVRMTEGEIPEFEKYLAENTPHNATSGYKTFVDTGKRSLNEFKVTLEWEKSATTHAAVQAAFDSTSPVNMSVVAPDGSETISFSAFVKNVARSADQEDYYKAEVTIQPTGAPTIA